MRRRGRGKEGTGVDGKTEEGEREEGRRGGDGEETGVVAINSGGSTPGGSLLLGGRSMALPVGLLSVSVYWLHSVAGLQHGGEERCDSTWGWTFENLSCHV